MLRIAADSVDPVGETEPIKGRGVEAVKTFRWNEDVKRVAPFLKIALDP